MSIGLIKCFDFRGIHQSSNFNGKWESFVISIFVGKTQTKTYIFDTFRVHKDSTYLWQEMKKNFLPQNCAIWTAIESTWLWISFQTKAHICTACVFLVGLWKNCTISNDFGQVHFLSRSFTMGSFNDMHLQRSAIRTMENVQKANVLCIKCIFIHTWNNKEVTW